MKWLIILVGVLACSSSTIPTKSIEKEECDVICWDYSRKLSWDDFMGEPDSLETAVGQATAATVAKVNCRGFLDKGMPNFIVTNHFLKKSSWVNQKNEGGLQHEQLHFDIAEIYARKIRKGIKELRNEGVKEIELYSSLIKRLLDERNKKNAQYDYETAHSLLEEEQQEWNEEIANELEQLGGYTSSSDGCECEEMED